MKVVDLSKAMEYTCNDPRFVHVKIKQKPHWISCWLMRVVPEIHDTCARVLK